MDDKKAISGEPAPLQPGTTAPDFSLHETPDQLVSLRELRGRSVILMFYPADWSPVCGSELALYNELVPTFDGLGAAVLGISVDGPWSHVAFAAERKIKFPLLSDFEPKGAVARLYGVYRAHDGITERALFVIDPAGTIRWCYVSPVGMVPGADGVLKALESIAGKQASLS